VRIASERICFNWDVPAEFGVVAVKIVVRLFVVCVKFRTLPACFSLTCHLNSGTRGCDGGTGHTAESVDFLH